MYSTENELLDDGVWVIGIGSSLLKQAPFCQGIIDNGGGVCGKSLLLPLDFIVNLKNSPLLHLLLGRKAMTNLDSTLKSRDITSLTKACLVKAMAFPAVIYGCEICTIKKAEHRRMDAFESWCWRRLLKVPWTARRSDQSILK